MDEIEELQKQIAELKAMQKSIKLRARNGRAAALRKTVVSKPHGDPLTAPIFSKLRAACARHCSAEARAQRNHRKASNT